ncbi:MAG: hypothetical protein AB7U95_13730 [Reyranella sp.]
MEVELLLCGVGLGADRHLDRRLPVERRLHLHRQMEQASVRAHEGRAHQAAALSLVEVRKSAHVCPIWADVEAVTNCA